jgi:RNA polymerase sigma-70 factor (ECF subfamily)
MNGSRLTSLSLVEGLMTNDSIYWDRFVTLYGPIVALWIRKAGIASSHYDDLQQEIFVAISKSIAQYRHDPNASGSLRRWMWGIARNKVSDHWRSELKQAAAAGGSTALQKIKELPFEPFEETIPGLAEKVRGELVSRALQILERDFEERTWQAFHRTVVEEQTTGEVAESLGMTTQAVRQARFRVLKRLRQELGGDLPE